MPSVTGRGKIPIFWDTPIRLGELNSISIFASQGLPLLSQFFEYNCHANDTAPVNATLLLVIQKCKQ